MNRIPWPQDKWAFSVGARKPTKRQRHRTGNVPRSEPRSLPMVTNPNDKTTWPKIRLCGLEHTLLLHGNKPQSECPDLWGNLPIAAEVPARRRVSIEEFERGGGHGD